jgi:hypothetical protein
VLGLIFNESILMEAKEFFPKRNRKSINAKYFIVVNFRSVNIMTILKQATLHKKREYKILGIKKI